MARFLIVLALASAATAINSYGYNSGYGGIGYPIGGIGYGSRLGVSKQYNTVGSSYGGLGFGLGGHQHHQLGVSKHFGIGSSYGGLGSLGVGGGLGVSKISTVGSTLGGYGGYGLGGGLGGGLGLGVSKQISSHSHVGVGGGLGGYGGIGKVSNIGINTLGAYGGLGALGGFGSLGLGGLGSYGLSTLGKYGIPAIAAIPSGAGYYGGLISYPQVIPTALTAAAIHHPHNVMDAYKGYYGGYFPGSVGYGHSYRFFH